MSLGQLTLQRDSFALTLADQSSITPLAEQTLSPLEQEMLEVEAKLQKVEEEKKCEEYELIFRVGELMGILQGKEKELKTEKTLLAESIEQIELVRLGAFEAYKDLYREQFSKTLSHIHSVLSNFIQTSKQYEATFISLHQSFTLKHNLRVCFLLNGQLVFFNNKMRTEYNKEYNYSYQVQDNTELEKAARDFETQNYYILSQMTTVKVYQTIFQYFYTALYDLAGWKGFQKTPGGIIDGDLNTQENEASIASQESAFAESAFALITAKSSSQPLGLMQMIQKKGSEFKALRDRITHLEAERDKLLVKKRKVIALKLDKSTPHNFHHVLLGLKEVRKRISDYSFLNYLSHFNEETMRRRGIGSSVFSMHSAFDQAISYMEQEYFALESVQKKLKSELTNRYGELTEEGEKARIHSNHNCSTFGWEHNEQTAQEAQQFLDERPLRNGKGKAL